MTTPKLISRKCNGTTTAYTPTPSLNAYPSARWRARVCEQHILSRLKTTFSEHAAFVHHKFAVVFCHAGFPVSAKTVYYTPARIIVRVRLHNHHNIVRKVIGNTAAAVGRELPSSINLKSRVLLFVHVLCPSRFRDTVICTQRWN
jgi:hypothetical protein